MFGAFHQALQDDLLNDASSQSDSDTRARPVAGVVTNTDTNEDCNDCEPRKRGSTFVAGRRFDTGDGHWPEYQLQIANMGGGPFFAIVTVATAHEPAYNNVYARWFTLGSILEIAVTWS